MKTKRGKPAHHNHGFRDMQQQEILWRLRKLARLPLGLFLICGLLAIGSPAAYGFWPFTWQKETSGELDTTTEPAVDKDEEIRQLIGAIGRLAEDLSSNYRGGGSLHDPLSEGVVVTSFVELKKLSRTSSLGRFLSEQLMSELQQRGYQIMELRKSRTIRLQEQRGEYGLSRNPGEVPGSVASGAMLSGTYTVAGDHVLVNARILDNRTTALLASATVVLPKDNLTRRLLSDRVSAGAPGKIEEVVYLKRLEP